MIMMPISLSLVTQAGLLENLHRFDTMIVEEVAKKGGHTITGLGARFVECRTSRAVRALVTPWISGKVATPCTRVAVEGHPWVPVGASVGPRLLVDIRGSPQKI
jgi:hypothetical protein